MPVVPHPVAVEDASREADWVWRRGVGVIPIVLAFVGGSAHCGRQQIAVAVLPEVRGGQGTSDRSGGFATDCLPMVTVIAEEGGLIANIAL